MLSLALKNITRQRVRTSLTVLGITIGIAAIVALGSISEGINETINKEMRFLGGTIIVVEKDSSGMITGFQGSEITQEQVEEIEELPGVKDVAPIIMRVGRLIPGKGISHLIVGLDPKDIDYFKGKATEIESGRSLEEGDTYSAVIGKKIAERENLDVGDFIRIKDKDFEVVGILEEIQGDLDFMIVIPIDTMMELYNLDTYRALYVIPEDVAEVEDLAEMIESEFYDLSAITTKEISKQMSEIVERIRFYTVGVASISALVGGLGVMNTMIMSVMERRREIGILKAIGATNKFVLFQILTESSIMSMIGGILGLFFGYLGIRMLNFYSTGMVYGILTPQLVFLGLGFAFCLGIFGGLYPAYSAASISPVEALRYE